MGKGKIIIFSAPSGSGKSTIIHRLMEDASLHLGFSISATSRQPRGTEKDGVEYYFISHEEFLRRAADGAFVEWEEVYPGTCYGTPVSEIERVTSKGDNLVLDIDVKGGLNVKHLYGDKALSLFIMPPSLEILAQRLRGRATDSEEMITRRLEKAEYELSFADKYDAVIVNDDLDEAVRQAKDLIRKFAGC